MMKEFKKIKIEEVLSTRPLAGKRLPVTAEEILSFHIEYDEDVPVTVDGDNFIYPAIKGGVDKCFPSLNHQDSKYHGESLISHVLYVTSKLEREYGPLGFYTGLLHDIGKKYTIAVNKKGDVCFYGHAAVSAIIANEILHRMNVNENLITAIVAAIYHHMDVKLCDDVASFYENYRMTYGDISENLLKSLAESDKGFEDEKNPELLEGVNEGMSLISLYSKSYGTC